MATIKEIATLAGVSRGTVDRVLNHRGSVNPQTEQKILDIIQDPHLDANPELHYQQKDEYSRLTEALEQLPFNEKQVLIMRYYNDMKLEEIAAAMEISRSSVKRYIASGQEHLKERMKG